MSAIPEPPQRLSDGVVELRAISEWDIPEVLIAHQDDPRMHLALGLDRPPTGAQLGREVEVSERRRLAGDGVALTIVTPGSDDCIGRIDVTLRPAAPAAAADPAAPAQSPGQTAGELRIWVSPQRRGIGVGRRALRLAAMWLLGEAGFERLTIDVPQGNVALERAATAAGFNASAGGGGELPPDPGRLELQR